MIDRVVKWVCIIIGGVFLLLSLFYAYLFGTLVVQQGITGYAFNHLGVSLIFVLLGLWPIRKILPARWR